MWHWRGLALVVTPGQQRPLWWRGRRSRSRRRRRSLWRRRGRRKRRPAWNLLTISSQLAVACTTSLDLTDKQQPILSQADQGNTFHIDVGHDSLVLSSQPTDPTESSIRHKSPDQSQVRSPIGISPPSDYQAIDNKTARLRRLIWLNSFKITKNFRF